MFQQIAVFFLCFYGGESRKRQKQQHKNQFFNRIEDWYQILGNFSVFYRPILLTCKPQTKILSFKSINRENIPLNPLPKLSWWFIWMSFNFIMWMQTHEYVRSTSLPLFGHVINFHDVNNW